MKSRIGTGFRRGAFACLHSLLILAVPTPGQATIMIELPLAELADGADAVVRGTVQRVGVRGVLKDGAVAPITVTIVRVTEWLKGRDQQATVEIRQEGGRLGDNETVVDGAAKFSVGEDVVVFLHRDRQTFRTWQMSQGKFRVVTRGDDGQRLGIRELDGVTFAAWDKGGELKFRTPGTTAGAVPLNELLGIARSAKPAKVIP